MALQVILPSSCRQRGLMYALKRTQNVMQRRIMFLESVNK